MQMFKKEGQKYCKHIHLTLQILIVQIISQHCHTCLNQQGKGSSCDQSHFMPCTAGLVEEAEQPFGEALCLIQSLLKCHFVLSARGSAPPGKCRRTGSVVSEQDWCEQSNFSSLMVMTYPKWQSVGLKENSGCFNWEGSSHAATFFPAGSSAQP